MCQQFGENWEADPTLDWYKKILCNENEDDEEQEGE